MSMFRRKNPADLAASLNALKGGSGFSSDDKKEWKLKDTDGVGSAVIRFLPSKNEENPSPFIKLVNHGFKNAGQWYIENCTSTHGDYENCPVCAYMNKNDLYNTNESEYRKLKRNTSYWANILVIKDPAVPSNEGQVFKYRFGKKIMDKINQMVEVDVDMGETAIDVTCPFEGANFVLKSKLVSGYKNYDDSKFMNQSEIAGINDEAFQKKLWDEMSDLNELLVFKSLEENQKKFSKVMGTAALGGAASKAAAQADKLGADLDDFDKDMEDFTSSKPAKSERTATAPSTPEPSDDGLDDLLAGL